MKYFNKALVRKTTVICATVLTVLGTTVNAVAATPADTSTEYMSNHRIQQNPSSRIILGRSSIFMYNTLNTDVKQKDVLYSYDPFSDVIEIRFADDLSGRESVFLDKKVRSELRSGYNQYLKDFAGYSQNEGVRHTSSAYGAVNSLYTVGMDTTTVKTNIGYTFVKRNPYFTLTLYENVNNSSDWLMGRRTILLTTQQAADLVSYISEEKLR